MGIHDGGYDGSGGGDERGIEIDSTVRAGGDHYEGHHDGDESGDGHGDEPYVVFGYGSLIFRVRLCSSIGITELIQRTRPSPLPLLGRSPISHLPPSCMHERAGALSFYAPSQPPPHVVKTSTRATLFVSLFSFTFAFIGSFLNTRRLPSSASESCVGSGLF
jgi:hypothetical protein